MKRKLDLNGPGARLTGVAAILLVVVPLALYLVGRLLRAIGVGAALISLLIRGSLLLGGAILAVLFALLIVEALQDRLYDRYYRRQRAHRLPAADGYSECQYCGNRRVAPRDTHCAVCGRRLA